MITEICAYLKNYFTYEQDKHYGTFHIENKQIVPSVDLLTDYFCIFGSRLNNGVHKVSDNDLVNEGDFDGSIWIMSPPADFLALVTEINNWQTSNGSYDSVAMSPFNSESFGGYSYSKGNNSSGAGGIPSASVTWQDVYAKRLNVYRRFLL